MAETNKKILPNIIIQDIARDTTNGLVMRERYVSISADVPLDELIKKARETIKEE